MKYIHLSDHKFKDLELKFYNSSQNFKKLKYTCIRNQYKQSKSLNSTSQINIKKENAVNFKAKKIPFSDN